jgi:hypothetical protein
VKDLNIVPLELGGKACPIAVGGLFERLPRVLIAAVWGLEAGAEHPVVKRAMAALDGLRNDFKLELFE